MIRSKKIAIGRKLRILRVKFNFWKVWRTTYFSNVRWTNFKWLWSFGYQIEIIWKFQYQNCRLRWKRTKIGQKLEERTKANENWIQGPNCKFLESSGLTTVTYDVDTRVVWGGSLLFAYRRRPLSSLFCWNYAFFELLLL